MAPDRIQEVEAELARQHEQAAGGLQCALDLGVIDEIVDHARTRRTIARAIAGHPGLRESTPTTLLWQSGRGSGIAGHSCLQCRDRTHPVTFKCFTASVGRIGTPAPRASAIPVQIAPQP
jgi:hypothetical protein